MSAPPTPPSDDKDWTWVLDRPCAECGFDAASVAVEAVPMLTRAAIGDLRAALAQPSCRVRPRADVWSPLEYASHVRDVCIVFGTRLVSMRTHDDPVFANWDQDETALASRYWEGDPAIVSDELDVEGARIAAAFESVRPAEWSRPGRRSNGSVFTVDTLARYFLHDLVHHVHDVTTDPGRAHPSPA